jgi:tetratricopeptide (TPR) repeat protein
MKTSEDKLRMGAFWQTELHQWKTETINGSISFQDTLGIVREEWPHILVAMNWCKTVFKKDRRAAILLSKLSGTAGHLLNHFLTVHDQIHWRDLAYQASKQAELVNDEMGHGLQLAFLHFQVGNMASANQLLDEIEKRNEACLYSPGDAKLNGKDTWKRFKQEVNHVRAGIQSHRAVFLVSQGKHKEALVPLERAIVFFREENNTNALLSCLNTQATALAGTGEYQKAIGVLDEVLTNDRTGNMVTAHINRGAYLLRTGAREDAYAALLKGEELARIIGDEGARALANVQLGFWHLGHAEPAERSKAHDYMAEARAMYRRLGDQRQLAAVLRFIAQMLQSITGNKQATDIEQAEAWLRLAQVQDELDDYAGMLESSEQYLKSTSTDFGGRLEAVIHSGHSLHRLGRHEEAIQRLEQARELLRRLREMQGEDSNQKAEFELLMILGQTHRQLSQTDAARDCYQEAMNLANAMNDVSDACRVNGNLGLLEVDCGLFEEGLIHLSHVIKEFDHVSLADGRERLRLLALAYFNLAYGQQKSGNKEEAMENVSISLGMLKLLNEEVHIKEVQRQVNQW